MVDVLPTQVALLSSSDDGWMGCREIVESEHGCRANSREKMMVVWTKISVPRLDLL